MKSVMNRREVSRFHKFLDEDLPIKKISGIMKVTVGCLNKFLPADVAKSNDAKAKVTKKAVEKAEKPAAAKV